MEPYLFPILVGGIVVTIIGYFWLVAAAFRTSRKWGFGVLLFPPAVFAFIPLHFGRTFAPSLTVLIGIGLLASPYVVNYVVEHFVDLGPRERVVDEEVHITLTGWDQKDYAILKARPLTVVLQMANPDVTDDTLQNLADMRVLRELDLNDTQVTDAGLAVLANLPALEILRLRNTKITDAGFKQHLYNKEWLLELDLTGTEVPTATARSWKKLKDGRRFLK